MNCCLVKKFKLWLIVTLIVVLAGMVMLGIFKTNTGVDLKDSYEVVVSVDQDVDNSAEKLDKAVKDYFASTGAKVVSSATQKVNDGTQFIYKLDELGSVTQTAIESAIASINSETVATSCAVNKVRSFYEPQIANLSICLGVIAVASFLYILAMEKLSAALSTLVSAVVSGLLFVSLGAITRVAVAPMFGVFISVAVVFALILSAGMTRRFREEKKNTANEKLTNKEVAEKVAVASITRFAFLFVAVLIVALTMGILGFVLSGCGYFVNYAIMLLMADVCGVFSAMVYTPVVWYSIKKN